MLVNWIHLIDYLHALWMSFCCSCWTNCDWRFVTKRELRKKVNRLTRLRTICNVSHTLTSKSQYCHFFSLGSFLICKLQTSSSRMGFFYLLSFVLLFFYSFCCTKWCFVYNCDDSYFTDKRSKHTRSIAGQSSAWAKKK